MCIRDRRRGVVEAEPSSILPLERDDMRPHISGVVLQFFHGFLQRDCILITEQTVSADALGAWPVSYTHLDVYKRQGMLTSVQDLGRIGYQQYGVSVSGVMDPRSASIANILVDNEMCIRDRFLCFFTTAAAIKERQPVNGNIIQEK